MATVFWDATQSYGSSVRPINRAMTGSADERSGHRTFFDPAGFLPPLDRAPARRLLRRSWYVVVMPRPFRFRRRGSGAKIADGLARELQSPPAWMYPFELRDGSRPPLLHHEL